MAELTTFSITARCSRTGMLGVAVASRFLAVGALCPHVRAGVGAVATQAMVNPLYGAHGLDLLSGGLDPAAAVAQVLSADEGRELRQVAVVDCHGKTAVHTGANCVPWAGHRQGVGFVVAGNMLAGPAVLEGMEVAFLSTEGEPLPERLLLALEAGQAAGGDKRGKQAAALLVHDTEAYPYVSLRVDDHPDPLPELRRLWALSQATFAPYRALMPTGQRPSGITDPEAIAAARAQASAGRPNP